MKAANESTKMPGSLVHIENAQITYEVVLKHCKRSEAGVRAERSN
jgi:hypothetical protein